VAAEIIPIKRHQKDKRAGLLKGGKSQGRHMKQKKVCSRSKKKRGKRQDREKRGDGIREAGVLGIK